MRPELGLWTFYFAGSPGAPLPTEVVRGCDDNQQDRMVGGDHGVLCGSHGHACRQIKELGCVAESAPLGPGEDALCRVCRNRRNHEAETRFYKSSALNRPPGGLGRYVHTLKVHVWGRGQGPRGRTAII